MKKLELDIIKSVTLVLNSKKLHPKKLDQEILKDFLESNFFLDQKKQNKLILLESVGKALNLKHQNKSLTSKQIIQLVLQESENN